MEGQGVGEGVGVDEGVGVGVKVAVGVGVDVGDGVDVGVPVGEIIINGTVLTVVPASLLTLTVTVSAPGVPGAV